MPNATDYWLQGMQVAEQERQSRKKESQTDRDYLTRNKLYYGEDWRGNDKGETDFKASEEARKARIAEDAAAALEPYLGGSRTPAVTDPRAVPGMSEADADFGAPQAAVESLPNTRQTAPAVGDFGAPIGTDVPVVRVVTPPKLTNTDSAGEDLGNWDEVLASLPKQTVPEVQPDAPRYIPVEDTLGSPPVTPAAAVPVVAPPVGNDFGASTIPTTPVRPTSPVPNTSTFGAPVALPTAREVYDRVDPRIQRNPAFLAELRKYEQNRLIQESRANQAEMVARIRSQPVIEGNAIKQAALELKKQQEAGKEKPSEVKAVPVVLPDGTVVGHGVLGAGGAVHILPQNAQKTSVAATPAALDRAIKHAETIIKDPDASEDDKAQAKGRLAIMLPQYYESLGVKIEPQSVTNTVKSKIPFVGPSTVVSTNYVKASGEEEKKAYDAFKSGKDESAVKALFKSRTGKDLPWPPPQPK